MDLHPNATVNLLPDIPSGSDYITWLSSRMAADEAPDIVWDQWFNRNRTLGYLVDGAGRIL